MFVLVGVDGGFLTICISIQKDLEAKTTLFGGGRCWFMRATWEAKSMRENRPFGLLNPSVRTLLQ